jgi:putative Holliday junction resolvase
VAERRVRGLVIGLPLNMDGSESPRSQGARAMARNLDDLGLPILLWDERWTTQAAERDDRAGFQPRQTRRAHRFARRRADPAGAIDALAGGVL